VGGRLKFTEQGEVVAAHYADRTIAQRHLEQVTAAALLASTPEHERRTAAAAAGGTTTMTELAAISRTAYRALVDLPGFASFFRAATPIDLIAGLGLGSRPSARPGGDGDEGGPDPARGASQPCARPWVLGRARANLPGWYGSLRPRSSVHGARRRGCGYLGSLYRRWPFFASSIPPVSLAKADLETFRQYADSPPARRRRDRAMIEAEYARSARLLLLVTGRDRLLAGHPTLARSIELRNPYVDALSAVQVDLLGRLRDPSLAPGERAALRAVVGATINGIAAGLQNTG
jgi:phosphoenolpyruvate carboxylase